MKLPKTSLIIGVVLISLGGSIHAQSPSENIVKRVSVNQIINNPAPIVIKTHQFTAELDKLNTELTDEKYPLAIDTAEKMIDTLKELQKIQLNDFFPSKFGAFSQQSWQDPSTVTDIHGGNYGVVLNRAYRNEEGNALDVNVVSSDASISEYISIVKNPRILQTLENVSLIKVLEKYDALAKKDDDGQFVEVNLILNRDLLINIIVNGVEDPKIIQKFFENCDFEGLATYLQK